MTPNKVDPLRIVESRPGAGTGETVYVTSDGRVWKHGAPAVDQTAAPSTGIVHGNYVLVE